MCSHCVGLMKNKALNIRMSERRLNKLRLYAQAKEKTMTQIIEDYIDRLPVQEAANNTEQ
ncbi:hypothetical protein G7B40_013315 [Aetokthonos hydrillicola Thurmond2011]|uniref:Uncharacterized protein n=1 Tax=Aetokthonos hydrillicola Thurmond2011 TaxID=2712845 RepID=A0AAP5I5R0_9CYAN|nr:hypothetical protein [Aetokthonos hydrillicola Thurmond2011]